MAETQINNSFYDEYGERWYEAFDDPIALLRAQNRLEFPWIVERVEKANFETVRVLDVGCGGGFLSNELGQRNYEVTAVDRSFESIKIAQKHDTSLRVNYMVADAYHLPFEAESFEVITAMDFLEHVERPAEIIREFSRVLKPGGLFFFHTFNRNRLSHLVVIKMVEWLVKNTPKNMHVIELFIKPEELKKYCVDAGLEVRELIGIRPRYSTIPLKNLISGIVPPGMEFCFTKNLHLSYLGMAVKM
jgi:2-polyprenyl-6-hydroxyphenyl methylase/3-demethylubiquinone-9 3-methyltransferase